MNLDEFQIPDEQPEDEPTTSEEVVPDIKPLPVDEEPPELVEEVQPLPPSKISRFLSRALRWVTGFVVVFALGMAATWAAKVSPLTKQMNSLQQELESTQAQLEAAQSEVELIQPLEDANASLKAEIAKSEQRMDLLSVLVDVTTAQLAMAQDDPIAAKAALAGTDERLMMLDEDLVGGDTVEGLRNRLALVIDELDTNTFAAQRDLQILSNNLISLERSLFGK
jgi:uncharacterized membrane-anchored protein YhcB (DUF1043 family)